VTQGEVTGQVLPALTTPTDQGRGSPALLIAPHLQSKFVVDHAQHDTTSILATIEHRFGIAPLSSRDAVVSDLSTVFNARAIPGNDGGADHD
jgi:phospholipase C